jgi:succinate dehydrogenase / fumarate reductase flavoprotein subunit
MYDTVKGSDWLGDQDAIEYMCHILQRTLLHALKTADKEYVK